MQYSAVQKNTVKCILWTSKVQYSAVQYSAEQESEVYLWTSKVQYSAEHFTVFYGHSRSVQFVKSAVK